MPITPAAVHDNIHYNQIGYNELGRESARNGLALRGWFELNQEGARERINDVIDGSFTIEATVDLDRGTGFSYIAGKCDDKCLALGIGEYDDGHTADYHNGHTFHSFRVYDSALTPEVLETITPKDQQVELWYDFDELTYLPTT